MPLIKRRGDEGNSRSETETLPPYPIARPVREQEGCIWQTDALSFTVVKIVMLHTVIP